MSDVFAGGNQTTARAAIKAAVLARITTGADGSKMLDVEGMVEWLNTEFGKMFPDNETKSPDAYTRVPVRFLVNTMWNAIRKEAYEGRPDFPKAADILTGTALLTAARDGQAELQRISESLTAHYDYLVGLIPQEVRAFATGQRTDKRMPDGVDRLVDSRIYRFTYVTDWGEESAPSDPSVLINVDQNDTVSIAIPAPPPGRFITKWRLYRSNTGTAAAAYQFVAEYPIAELTVTEEKKGEELGEVLVTEGWYEPPAGLAGLVAVPNGIMAGFVGNTVCFSDPYHPYAWPIEYQVTLAHPVVGLGVIGQGVLALTRGGVFLLTGADSSQMTAQAIDGGQACVNPRTIVSMDSGVIYASPDGLCYCDGTRVQLLTEQHITREDWREMDMQNPAVHSAEHDGSYFIFTPSGAWVFDLTTQQLMQIGVIATAAWTDKVTDTLCAAVGDRIHGLFIGTGRRTGKWRSKLATLGAQAPFAWITVASNFEAGPVTVRWFADGVLRHTASFTNIEPQRLPPGRWLEHQVEVESKSRVTLVFLASSTRELQAV